MKSTTTWIKTGVTGPDLPLNGYDYLVTHTYISLCLIYKKKLDDARIKTAIEKVLPSFPLLTGRLVKDKDGYTVIAQNDHGFWFEFRQSDEPYQELSTENNFSKKLKQHSYKKLRVVNQNAPLCAVIITHFKDQGSVLSISVPHSLVDSTIVYFLIAIVQEMNGQPIPKYLFSRDTLNFPAYQPKGEEAYDSLVKVNLWDKVKLISKIAYGYLVNNKTLHLKIEGSTMKQLKIAGKQVSETLKVSEEDLLAAILWKTIATIRKDKAVPLMSYTVNMRFKTSLDINYFGNASTGYLYYTTKEILNKSIEEIAQEIRAGLNAFGDDYASKETHFLDKLVKEKKTDTVFWKELCEGANNRAFIFDPGHKFPFYAMDFGSGSPSWYELPEIPLSGFVYTIINPDMQSVDMKVNLPKHEINAFLKLYNEAMAPFLAK